MSNCSKSLAREAIVWDTSALRCQRFFQAWIDRFVDAGHWVVHKEVWRQPVLELSSDFNDWVALDVPFLFDENICVDASERIHEADLRVLYAGFEVASFPINLTPRDGIQLDNVYLRPRQVLDALGDSLANYLRVDSWESHGNVFTAKFTDA